MYESQYTHAASFAGAALHGLYAAAPPCLRRARPGSPDRLCQGLLNNAKDGAGAGTNQTKKASNMTRGRPIKVRRWSLGALALLAGLVALWLWLAPPAMLRVATGYAAKIVCSGVFVAGRDARAVLRVDVQAPGHPILRFVSVSVDRDARVVRAGLPGFAGDGLAVARDGTGCASVPDGDLRAAAVHRAAHAPVPAESQLPWPLGEVAGDPAPAIQALLRDPALTGPGMRAVLVLRAGAARLKSGHPGRLARSAPAHVIITPRRAQAPLESNHFLRRAIRLWTSNRTTRALAVATRWTAWKTGPWSPVADAMPMM